ncbi:hypothetical protein HS125_06390 [bacterium]|nr:hypothetical protein [bacterium]
MTFVQVFLYLAGIPGLTPVFAAGTVEARFLYEDRVFAATGWTGALVELPIRGARAVLENGSGVSLDVKTTGEDGGVTFTHPGSGSQLVRVRVEARHPEGWFRVARNSGSTYSAVSALTTYDLDGGAVIEVVALYRDNGQRSVGGAFNIYDILLSGFTMLRELDAALAFPALTAYWEVGSLDGTYYSSNALHILGGSDDTDEYDDAIIAHEFGHYVSDAFSRDESPGGQHYLNQEYRLTLSWSEGMAHYLSSLFRGTPVHFDSYGDVDYLGFNLEEASVRDEARDNFAVAPGAACELRVAAALWDCTDPIDDDPIQIPATDFWTLFHLDIPAMPSPINMESFFLAWRARWGARADWPDFPATLAGQSIFYFSDGLEQNNKVADATDVAAGARAGTLTLFDAGDEDWFSVPVVAGGRYVFRTHDLHNGADTVLTLWNESATSKLAENDNSGERDALGRLLGNSRIGWTADRTGSVRLQVRHVTTTYSARYGSYLLSAYRSADFDGDNDVDEDDLAAAAAARPDFDLDGRRDYRDWFELAVHRLSGP